jgi:hypothetical protein
MAPSPISLAEVEPINEAGAQAHGAIFQIRSMRLSSFFEHVFIPKSAPTFGRHALDHFTVSTKQ